ncbi:MAG: acyl-CoA dehydrogenase family protein [Gemmatimonadales bacterium]|nr:MAG: acyl-CoA dehydrogenase family protein [Gemmatimonadales bacterium]
MHRYFTESHLQLRNRVRAFAQESVVPVARELDASCIFPWENVRTMGEMGLLGIPVPGEYGGQGLDYTSYILAVDELARFDASHAITVSAHTTLGSGPILEFGTEEQRAHYLPLLASGRVLGGFGLTEPGAGSDSGGTRTRAVREGAAFRINGSKIFITHAGVGEIFTVTAVTDSERGAKGISSFVVTKPSVDAEKARSLGLGPGEGELEYIPGVRSGKKEDKMGWRASDTRELLLEDALVPQENLLGEEGRGFVNFMRTLDAGRIGVAGLSLGLARGAFDAAVRYTAERRQFGRPLYDFQQVQFPLADIATAIQAGEHLTYHAAWLKDQGHPYTKEASMAKLFCSELAMEATLKAIQLMGGAGYSDDFPVERMARDAKICEIGEGTSEVQRLVIARHVLREALGA